MSDTSVKEQDNAVLADLDAAEAKGEILPPQAHTGLIDPPAAAADTQAAPAAPATTQEAATVQAAAAPQEQPRGNVNAALRAARHAEREALRRAEELERQLADARAGKPAPVDTRLTEADLEQAGDFPVLQKIVARQLAQDQQSQQQPNQAAAEGFVPIQYQPDVQDAIDSVPELVSWQYDAASQDKFAAAIEADNALRSDPEWQDKPLQERLAEVVRRITAPPQQRADPAKAIEQAQLAPPKGISDFRGGADPGQSSIDFRRMTDDQIMATL